MTFGDLKAEILDRTKRVLIAEEYQALVIAADKPAIIAAGIERLVCAYKLGVMDDTLIAEFDETDLNAAGIYTGATSLTNPTTDVYLLKDAVVDITIDANNKCKISTLGNAALTLTVNDNGFVDLKCYNSSSFGATFTGYCALLIEMNGSTSATSLLNDNGVMKLTTNDDAILSHAANNDSYTAITAYSRSSVSYTLADAAEVEAKKYQQATITDSTP